MDSLWMCHAYDNFVCDHPVIAVLPDSALGEIVYCYPIDRWQTQYHVDLLDVITGKVRSGTLDMYDNVLCDALRK